MPSTTYDQRRSELKTYFDETAAAAWERLTSEAPVSGIRATVRAGRDEMRALLLAQLPGDLRGARVLDAGCGPGQLSFEAARRGAEVVGVDLSGSLLDLGRARSREEARGFAGSVVFEQGDMLRSDLGRFDYTICMDSLIHYPSAEIGSALSSLAERTNEKIVFTFAPRTLALTIMHMMGRFFPKADKAPAIEPVSERRLQMALSARGLIGDWSFETVGTVSKGFYISSAGELLRA